MRASARTRVRDEPHAGARNAAGAVVHDHLDAMELSVEVFRLKPDQVLLPQLRYDALDHALEVVGRSRHLSEGTARGANLPEATNVQEVMSSDIRIVDAHGVDERFTLLHKGTRRKKSLLHRGEV